jgi:hypothetical protein
MPLESYDEQSEREDIESRYANVLNTLPRTLPHLQQSPSFLLLVKQLRSNGWKDWHILQAVFNGVVNWTTQWLGTQTDRQRDQEGDRIVRRLLKHGESPDDPLIPSSYFTIETMEMLLDVGVATFLKKKGAIFRPRAYNFQKLRQLAQKRYHYLDLDVPHKPLF